MPNYQPNYVVGRGSLYFNKFKKNSNTPETGELYFGNTPEFTITSDSETLDHYSSEQGMRNLDARVMLEYTPGGSFTCDEINADNLALHFLGENTNITQLQMTDRKEIIPVLKRARYYQLGIDDVTPSGVRNINNLQIVVASVDSSISLGAGDVTSIPGATVLPADNYEVDLANGRIYIEPDASAVGAEGMQAAVQYDVDPQVRNMVIGKADMIYGSLRFISDNPVGGNKDYFFPKVALTPDGDYALKGDDWQVMSFTFSAMKLNSRTAYMYIDVRSGTESATEGTTRTITATPAATSSTVGTAVNVTITVRDGSNNLVQNEAVTLTANSGSTVTPASGSTNASGQLVVQLNRATAGTGTVTATLDSGKSVTSAQVTFAAA
ncbi:structural protein [Cronobacter phage JC01]|uniref:Structural protein n=1 Tax=Cronobacter phage JC01 TaxID=2729575 RepID=A0A6M3YKC8_9CAUD|nr:major tail protein with Ig-like domain [Cronobacter phage JC01]QJI52240.1 structural protein [Cronobacter phage JC01]